MIKPEDGLRSETVLAIARSMIDDACSALRQAAVLRMDREEFLSVIEPMLRHLDKLKGESK